MPQPAEDQGLGPSHNALRLHGSNEINAVVCWSYFLLVATTPLIWIKVSYCFISIKGVAALYYIVYRFVRCYSDILSPFRQLLHSSPNSNFLHLSWTVGQLDTLRIWESSAALCSTLQHSAALCSTLQHSKVLSSMLPTLTALTVTC